MQELRSEALLKDYSKLLPKKSLWLWLKMKTQKQPYHIVKAYTPSFKENLSRKAIDKSKPDLKKRKIIPLKCLAKCNKQIFLQLHKTGYSSNTFTIQLTVFWSKPLWQKLLQKQLAFRTDGQSGLICEQFQLNMKIFQGGSNFQNQFHVF